MCLDLDCSCSVICFFFSLPLATFFFKCYKHSCLWLWTIHSDLKGETDHFFMQRLDILEALESAVDFGDLETRHVSQLQREFNE